LKQFVAGFSLRQLGFDAWTDNLDFFMDEAKRAGLSPSAIVSMHILIPLNAPQLFSIQSLFDWHSSGKLMKWTQSHPHPQEFKKVITNTFVGAVSPQLMLFYWHIL
jgi:hypothetical protein